jgi:hypothetical protein
MLVTAAVTMSLFLLASSLVTTALIPPEPFASEGVANNRALAYLAHGGLMRDGAGADRLNPLFGEAFGTLYDVSTILILSLAGASVTIGLRDLVPPYLHRLGMELHWAHAVGVILYVFNAVKLVVTLIFHADVNAQRGAYATSVLALMVSAAAATVIDRWPITGRRSGRAAFPWYFLLTGLAFGVTLAAVVAGKPDGITIALWSIVAILVSSMVSRVLRTTELRFDGFEFVDDQSRFLWQCLEYLEFPVLVPHHPAHKTLAAKEERIRQRHRLAEDVPIVFLEASLGDPSEFYQLPLLEVRQEFGRFALRITRCVSIPHAVAAVALELSKVGTPPEIHFGWSDESPFAANLNFVLFGQGNIPWMVRELVRKAEPNPERRPHIIIG